MKSLPAGWEWATIGTLLAPMDDGRTIHQGWSPRCQKTPSPADEVWGVLKTTAIQPGVFLSEHNKELPSGLDPRAAIEVHPGDLLLTCAGPRSRCGVSCLVRSTRPKLMISGKMYRFRVDDRFVSANYLEAYLQTAQAWIDIDQMKTGGSDSGLNLTQARFRELPIPLAPRQEQERIVDAVEEQLSRIEASRTTVEAARLRLRLMRLKIMDEVMTDAPRQRLGDLAVDARYGTSTKCAYQGHGPGVLRIPNIIEERVDSTDLKFAVDQAGVSPATRLEDGDVVFVRTNGSRDLIGRAATVTGEAVGLSFASYLIRYRFDDDLDPGYVCAAVSAPTIRRVLEGMAATTAGQYNLSLSKLDEVEIPVPSLETQRHLVAGRSGSLEAISRLDRTLEAALSRGEALRRSILAAAFAGQLVPQDPRDGAASSLLGLIESAQKSVPSTNRKRKAATT